MKRIYNKDGTVDAIIDDNMLVGCILEILPGHKVKVRIRGPVRDLRWMIMQELNDKTSRLE